MNTPPRPMNAPGSKPNRPPPPRRPQPPRRSPAVVKTSWIEEPRRTWLFRGVISGLLLVLLFAGVVIWNRQPQIFAGEDKVFVQIMELHQAVRAMTRGMAAPQGNLIAKLTESHRLPSGSIPTAIAAAGGGELMMAGEEGGYAITLTRATPKVCSIILKRPPVLSTGLLLAHIELANGAIFDKGVDESQVDEVCQNAGNGPMVLHFK